MHKITLLFLIPLLFISCKKESLTSMISETENQDFITAVDISSYPEIIQSNPTFYDSEGLEDNFLNILKVNGINTVRLRLWVNPHDEHSGFEEVKRFSETLKSLGFKTWLTLHYSNTWADPGHQQTPVNWQGLSFNAIKDSLYTYTNKIVQELKPHYIQIGNEINSGFLHPYGDITNNFENFIELIKVGTTAVRTADANTKIILHFAGMEGADWFFKQVNSVDYDIIGLSYYPLWHGKSINALGTLMNSLSESYQKNILIAETAYPFTLEWNDWTNNIVGTKDQLILPEFPASAEGQRKFIQQIRELTSELEKGLGFCYWGAELIAWKGKESKEASPWENQALFDFDNHAVAGLKAFKNNNQ